MKAIRSQFRKALSFAAAGRSVARTQFAWSTIIERLSDRLKH
ncbi:MAG: hypothetical protein ABR572_10830 [Cryomorphaceae bacterium]